MKLIVRGILIAVVVAATVFGQSTKQQLDDCIARVGDEQMINRKLKDEAKRVSDENTALKKEKDAAVAEKDRAVKQSDDLKAKNADLEKKNKELTQNVAEYNANAGTLQMLANENNRLATENQNLKNQLAVTPVAVAAPAPVEKFLYPVSGVLNNKSISNNVIVADFIFVNNGSRTINSFDCILKFYVKERKIYEIALPNVRNMAGAATGRNESINFRAGLPITDQNLVNAPAESIDLIVEVTKIQ